VPCNAAAQGGIGKKEVLSASITVAQSAVARELTQAAAACESNLTEVLEARCSP